MVCSVPFGQVTAVHFCLGRVRLVKSGYVKAGRGLGTAVFRLARFGSARVSGLGTAVTEW